jgi:hypothetical protein
MNVYRKFDYDASGCEVQSSEAESLHDEVITALRSPINKTVSSRCDPKPGSLTGDAVQFSVGRQLGSYPETGL